MSTPAIAMPYTVDGPLPLAPPYGLVPSADVVTETDPHWQNGVAVWGYPPALPSVIGGCALGTLAVKDDPDDPENPTFGPFTVYLPYECSKRTFRSYDELKRRLTVAFDAADSWAVAREFANGYEVPLNPFLTDGNLVMPLGGTAVSPEVGLAFLEKEIGDTGRQGVIHAPPQVVQSLTDLALVREGGKLRTLTGNLVVSDGGYSDAIPIDNDVPLEEGTSWIFATGPVQIRRTGVFIPQDRVEQAMQFGDDNDNRVRLYAERNYVVDWDAELQAGVLVDWGHDH